MDCNDVGIQDTFWLQVLQAWCKYNCKEPDTKAKYQLGYYGTIQILELTKEL